MSQVISLCKRYGFDPVAPKDAMIVGELQMERKEVEGEVMLSREFLRQPALVRLDTLKDIIGLLEREYEQAHKEFWGQA